METKQSAVDRKPPVREKQIYSEQLFRITFRESGRYIGTKLFWASSFAEAIAEAEAWVESLPTYADDEHWARFDYDYVGH
jgi:hypothetical protein